MIRTIKKELKERIKKEKPVLADINDSYSKYLISEGYKPMEILNAWTLAQLDFQKEGELTQQVVCRDILRGEYHGKK